ncbi:MAG: carbohydrate kinase family protein [Candidatus Spechtbacterales bacterium]|nr:carbohydrate kinase family protein [Candidatus Spechtbacterales bacterium]
MPKYDIITIGSATRDMYMSSDAFQKMKSDNFDTGEALCLPAGSKVLVEDIYFTTGGDAVNTAVTFAGQGLKTAIICRIGKDLSGMGVRRRLEEMGAKTGFIEEDSEHKTDYSVIISAQGKRTILSYKGASAHFDVSNFNFGILKKTKWIYLSHLSGDSAELFEPILKRANDMGVKVALNPGSTQLKMGEDMEPLLAYVDILFVNQEEASILTGIDYKKEKDIFEKLDKWVDGIVVMTKGPEGVIVSDGSKKWEAGIVKEPEFKDRTGAGDAFASGFTTAIIRGQDISSALQLASTNAAGVLSKWGANRGLLTKKDSPEIFGKLQIKETKL